MPNQKVLSGESSFCPQLQHTGLDCANSARDLRCAHPRRSRPRWVAIVLDFIYGDLQNRRLGRLGCAIGPIRYQRRITERHPPRSR